MAVVSLVYTTQRYARNNYRTQQTAKKICITALQNLIIPKLCKIAGSVLYFFGDNIPKDFPTAIPQNVTAVFLMTGVLLYLVLPTSLHRLQHQCKGTRQHTSSQSFDRLIPNENETDSLIVAITDPLTMIINFDISFTLIINGTAMVSCNTKVWKPLIFTAYCSLTILFIFLQTTTAIVHLYKICQKGKRKRSGWKNKICIHDTAIGIIMLLITILAVAAFLLIDNKHTLDCAGIEKLAPVGDEEEESKTLIVIRLTIMCIRFAVFTTMFVLFLCRKELGFVKLKGNLVSVNVSTLNNSLTAYFKECNGIVQVEYPLSSNTDTTSGSHMDHRSAAYEEDIKQIVKYLGVIGNLVAVNVRNNEVTVVRMIDGKMWVVIYSIINSKDAQIQHQVYEEGANERQITPQDSDTLLAANIEEDQICAVYLRQHEDQQPHMFHKIRLHQPCVNYASINSLNSHQVSVIQKDPLVAKCAKYDPNAGTFTEITADPNAYQPVEITIKLS